VGHFEFQAGLTVLRPVLSSQDGKEESKETSEEAHQKEGRAEA
jgi:hypothetical protein